MAGSDPISKVKNKSRLTKNCQKKKRRCFTQTSMPPQYYVELCNCKTIWWIKLLCNQLLLWFRYRFIRCNKIIQIAISKKPNCIFCISDSKKCYCFYLLKFLKPFKELSFLLWFFFSRQWIRRKNLHVFLHFRLLWGRRKYFIIKKNISGQNKIFTKIFTVLVCD